MTDEQPRRHVHLVHHEPDGLVLSVDGKPAADVSSSEVGALLEVLAEEFGFDFTEDHDEGAEDEDDDLGDEDDE